MKLRRSNLVYAVSVPLVKVGLSFRHKIIYEGAENVPKEGPAMVLVKHQLLRDILIEGLFFKYCRGRKGNWIMRSTLPGLLELLGGIPTPRPGDLIEELRRIRKLPHGERGAEKERVENEYHQGIEETINRMTACYEKGEMVVMHPEGKRKRNSMRKLKTTYIDATAEFQKETGIEVPAIPVGIEYSGWFPRRKVYIRAGEPLNVARPDIADVVYAEIKRLSNLD